MHLSLHAPATAMPLPFAVTAFAMPDDDPCDAFNDCLHHGMFLRSETAAHRARIQVQMERFTDFPHFIANGKRQMTRAFAQQTALRAQAANKKEKEQFRHVQECKRELTTAFNRFAKRHGMPVKLEILSDGKRKGQYAFYIVDQDDVQAQPRPDQRAETWEALVRIGQYFGATEESLLEACGMVQAKHAPAPGERDVPRRIAGVTPSLPFCPAVEHDAPAAIAQCVPEEIRQAAVSEEAAGDPLPAVPDPAGTAIGEATAVAPSIAQTAALPSAGSTASSAPIIVPAAGEARIAPNLCLGTLQQQSHSGVHQAALPSFMSGQTMARANTPSKRKAKKQRTSTAKPAPRSMACHPSIAAPGETPEREQARRERACCYPPAVRQVFRSAEWADILAIVRGRLSYPEESVEVLFLMLSGYDAQAMLGGIAAQAPAAPLAEALAAQPGMDADFAPYRIANPIAAPSRVLGVMKNRLQRLQEELNVVLYLDARLEELDAQLAAGGTTPEQTAALIEESNALVELADSLPSCKTVTMQADVAGGNIPARGAIAQCTGVH